MIMASNREGRTKIYSHGRITKQCMTKISPEKLTFCANFTKTYKAFDVILPGEYYASMHKDIFGLGAKKPQVNMLEQSLDELEVKVFPSDNPTYEDPKDVIGQRPQKPPRKRPIQGMVVSSPRAVNKDSRTMLKEQKRKLTKKYESLIVTLMDRCEENVILITEKESHIMKLKEKLKSVLEYNKLFAEENDQLKEQHAKMLKYIEDCKAVIQELELRSKELDLRNKELKERVQKFEVPDREHSELSTAIPLVEVCMSCSSRQIILTQVRDHNVRLQKDLQALKDVLYRLNVQLAKYQERLRNNVPPVTVEGKEQFVHKPASEAFDSLITTSLGYKQETGNTEGTNKSGRDTPTQSQSGRVVDLSGLLSAQALAPLFDAYQENLQEKESLILDYEKQFENINRKSKQLVAENKSLQDRVNNLEAEVLSLSKSEKRLALERETMEMEKQTVVERAEKAEAKLKEVYELYEDKMATMMRDYEMVHREYFATKNQLALSESRAARLDASVRERTVPADLHERRVDHCKRLLEELKHQYGMENERKMEQLAKLQEQKAVLEEKYNAVCREHDKVKEELKAALKNVRLYRKAAVIFRQRLKASNASITTLRKTWRRRSKYGGEPLKHALEKLERIKDEIKAVKSRASTSLQELERRLVQQERRAARADDEYRRELERAHLVLEHKEGIIRSLIDKVADVEEIRLSQTNTQRLQGIVSDGSDKSTSSKNKEENRRDEKKLLQGHGGYYQDSRVRKNAS